MLKHVARLLMALAFISAFSASAYAGQFKDLVVDYGADPTGVADSTASFNSACTAAATNDTILIPPGNFKKTGTITCSKNLLWLAQGSLNSTGTLPIGNNIEGITENNYGTRKIFQRTVTHDNDYAMVEIQTKTSHTGGTAGNTMSPLLVDTTVSGNVNNNYWSILATLDNFSSTGYHSGFMSQMKHEAGAGWGSAAVLDFEDVAAAADPVAGQVTLELDNSGNGTDNSGNGGMGSKVLLNLAVGKRNVAGAVNEVGWGSWATCYNGDNSQCHFKVVHSVAAPFAIGFDTSNGVQDTGGAAFRSKENQDWVLGNDSVGQVKFHLNSSNRRIEFLENGVIKGYIDLSGANHAL